jgi:ATP:ADP antiporter, AAA family
MSSTQPVASIGARLPAGALVATIASAALIAQQVAGKAARDALFLSSFDVRVLPAMMAASAILSLVAVLWLSQMLVKHSPTRVVPIGFELSAVALMAEWALSFMAPRLAAVAVYLHTSVFGAAMISAFWSLITETFDPHTGKRAVTWITGGGTLGGVLGGLVAWRASALVAVPTMLPLLAALNVLCLWGTLRLLSTAAAPVAEGNAADVSLTPSLAPLRVLRDAPYLRNLAWVVALGAATSGILDYVFSAEAVKVYAHGPALLSFFARFWLVVGVLSFALQTLLGRFALEKLGLAVTIGLLPGVVMLGGAVGLAVPGLWSTAILRGAEATHRNSLFRSAYELLYTPLSEQKRRSTKTLIDVGFDRAGTVAASAVAMVTLVLRPAAAEMILLLVAMGCAFLGLARSGPLHKGYVASLEESLRKAAEDMAPAAPAAVTRTTMEKAELHDKIVEQLQELPPTRELAAIASGDAVLAPKVPEGDVRTAVESGGSVDPLAQAVLDLRSGNAQRVRRVLSAETPMAAPLVSFAILLLGDREFHFDAIGALRKVAPQVTGQLVDALCDAAVDFDIRRRVPRVLSECSTQTAVEGLLRGAEGERFEVRYACGRALLKVTGGDSGIVVAPERVIALVKREVKLSKEIWESQAASQIDEEEYETPALFDRLVRDRIDRSLEHVFNILALQLDRESVQIAFNALHEEDSAVRGTALEYLETVLPDEIRDAVWPYLGEQRPMRAPRPAKEILADLVRARGMVSSAGALPGSADA